MWSSRLCGGERVWALICVGMGVPMSHNQALQAPKKREQVLVVLPSRGPSGVRQDRAFGERLGFGGEVDLRVHVRRVDRDVPEPRADRVDVDTGAQKMGRGRVTNGMRAEARLW